MSTKNKTKPPLNWASGLVVVVLVFGVGLFLRSLLPVQSVEASGIGSSDVPSAAGRELGNEVQVQTKNGISVTATNFRIEDSKYKIDVCFEMPDSSDWTIWQAALVYEGQRIESFGADPIEIRLPEENGKQQVTTFTDGQKSFSESVATAGAKGQRCDTVYFFIPDESKTAEAVLIISSIAAYPGEGQECNQSYLQKVNDALKTYGPSLQADCVSKNSGTEGVSGLVIVSKPDDMSLEDAQAILNSNEFFIAIHGVVGPWEFVGKAE